MTATDDAGTEDRLALIPSMDLPFDGHARQALGIDLPAVVINLAHRTDRWEAVSRRMGAAGIDRLIKAPAVEGAKLSQAHITKLLAPTGSTLSTAPESHLTLTRPAIGCYLSHLAIWRWIIAHDLPRVLVLEDDAHPATGFSGERFARIVSSLPRERALVFPGCLIMGGLADRPVPGQDLARLYYFNGTFGYLITPAACRFLLQRMLQPDRHVDHKISQVLMAERATFFAYYAAPPLLEPDWSLMSDCYVPLSDDTSADRELGAIIDTSRATLLAEGRPLLPLHG